MLTVGAFMAAGWCWAIAGATRLVAPERAWAAGVHDRPPRWSESVPFVLGVGIVALAAFRPDPELRIAAVAAVAILAVRAMETLSIGRGLLTERDRLLVTDPLTGAYNRRFLATEMGRAFSRAARGGEALSAIALDLDHFKEVNDRCGHEAGDLLLQAVATAASADLRASDVFCRLGGDEFLVLCPGTDAAGAAVIAERLRGRIADAAGRVVPEIAVTASLGIATYPADADEPDTMLRNADTALYAAKRTGRDAVAHYAPRDPGLAEAEGAPESRW
jgi:diguanylate cyclase (GGDEF)-like protein